MRPGPPPEASLNAEAYAEFVRERIARGLREIEEGKSLTQEEAEAEMDSWELG